MMNNNFSSEFIFSAPERELLTLSLAEIIDGLMADYKGFSHGNDAGIRIPDKKQEPRMSHSCILYAEGLRLAHSHPELAKKLILASLFDFIVQANYWLGVKKKKEEEMNAKGSKAKEFNVLEAITEFNHYNTRAVAWLNANGGADQLEELLKDIKDFEDLKAAERKKEAEEKMRFMGMAK